ncbi:MAG: 2-C-methyl-D-erythritol 4-phosphate cytidylyltransferase [Elusimicrobia bacterium]|nr:2-C-methyl-D-erythritol 4-phosphate cytidylyltransferase [Elusimicrobiota bacterium]
MKAGAIIVAAGSGTRMGRPKQFLPLRGRPVVEWTLDTFLSVPNVEEIVLVMTAENIAAHGERLKSDRVRVVAGGDTRMESVKNGLAALSEDVDIIAVHDGARPLVTPEVIRACLEEAEESGACVPAVPVKDTLKKVTNKQMWVSGTPERSTYWLAQTPQTYRREFLEEAIVKFPKEKNATDESQLVERAGHKVKIVPSTYENIKITTPEDLAIAGAFMDRRIGAPPGESRAGFGFDIHKLVANRELWLAGVQLEHKKGLLGHSDGDVVLHAACDAILGACGLGEIGMMFPPEDKSIKGIASKEIVKKVLAKVKAKGARILHLDVTLVAEEPKLKPHYGQLSESLQKLFSLPEGRVSLKAKSHEGLGEIGKGEAISCYAVATVSLP